MSTIAFLLLFLFSWAADSKKSFPIKRLAGPPEEFHLHRVPDPSSVVLTERSSTTNIWYDQVDEASPDLLYSTIIPVDGPDEFVFTFSSPHSNDVYLEMIDPNGNKVDLDKFGKEDFFPIGDSVQIPTTVYLVLDAIKGKYTLNVYSKNPVTESQLAKYHESSDPNAIVTLVNNDNIRLESSMSSYIVKVSEPLGIVARMTSRDITLVDGPIHVDSAFLEVFDPEGESVEIPMQDDGMSRDGLANDGNYAAHFTPKEHGQYLVQAHFKGWYDEDLTEAVSPTPFMRTTNYIINVSRATLELDDTASIVSKDGERVTLRIGVSNSNADQPKVRAYAEVYGKSKSDGSEVAVCWVGGISPLQGDSVELELNLRWLARVGAEGPLVLRNVFLSDMSTSFPISATSKDIHVSGNLSLLVGLNFGESIEITKEMREGINPLKNMTRSNKRQNQATFVTLPGYCAGDNPWSRSPGDWSNAIHLKIQGNHDNEEFANLVMEQVENLPDFGILGHSQGGMVSAHIHNYYFSGLEAATGGRLIQTVGTPYLGCSAAGSAASLGKVFGVGCGSNNDLSVDGATNWLTGITTTSRHDVYFYTTTYQQGKMFGDWCSLPMNTVLQWPNDGTAELKYAQLSGGNNLGNKEKWCHTTDMGYPAQYDDHTRNVEINKLAAR